ncbi:unnamed protein product [Arctia plantaginis]|uniref:Uncharacterized protein n=1 Tax=Arctia plantaginis TaxID=874455 RepID=A0A8S1AHS7_ARCPL|nr:unnamed protein product [Arctia plantaginis]
MVAIYFLLLSSALFVSAEHSGAYSSPQYAKKMYPKKGYDTNALLPREKPPALFKDEQDSIARFDNGNDTAQYGRSSFLEAAGSFLSGTGGQVVTSIARDFISRSTGSSQVGFDCVSQVLSLNLTNLVILIILKALILAAGFFGAGAWKGGHYYGRSLDDNKNVTYITEEEILLYLSYIAGQQKKDYGCLYLLSCQKPQQAGLYASGSELLLQGARMLQGTHNVDLEPYAEISRGIKQATEWGERGMNCDTRYKCGE